MADNRIAYGLAKKYGIDTKGMSPKDVWDALKGRGVTQQNAGEKYSSDGMGGMHDESPAETVRLREIGISEDGWDNDLAPRGQTDIPSWITKEDFVESELGVDAKKAQEYVAAVEAYADNKYIEIRNYQQGAEVEPQEEIAKQAKNLEEYIKKAPRWNGGETFRGMGLSNENLASYEVGSVHDMNGISSWSNEIEIARQFGDEYKNYFGNSVILHSPTQGKGTAIRHLSKYPGENEILVSKDSRYRVVKRQSDDKDRIHIYLEEV